ncbi:hypothetical protein FSP39_000503 [Pinctada imbricata]|uniref:Nuclear pore complex protein Nup160 homolog n=1 Tax=Pinctada imbricata TaxID=66713 RepID=A0AA89C094_PINIB|nr:hypothetical protein FSP39_000503 [Pinctada imbricata]
MNTAVRIAKPRTAIYWYRNKTAQPYMVYIKDEFMIERASASTLQDIKVPDLFGGYTYQGSSSPNTVTSNRFIYWRTNNDTLELIEESLDYDLVGHQVRLRFQDTQILGGVSIHESHNAVIILLVTVASVHRLIFPHPHKLQKSDEGYQSTNKPVPSIFYDASLVTVTDPQNMHLLNHSGSLMTHLHSAATYLDHDGSALFTFCCNQGSIQQVKMPPLGTMGVVQQNELTQSSMMQKLWSGLVPAVIRGGQECIEAATSVVISPWRGQSYMFAVCRDHKLRIWTTKTQECVCVYNLLECCNTLKNAPPVIGSGHSIKRVLSGDVTSSCMLCVWLNFPNRNEFVMLQPQDDSSGIRPCHVATVSGTNDDLVDFCATEQSLWTLRKNKAGESVISVYNRSKCDVPNSWTEVILHPAESSDIYIAHNMDPREVYIKRIFEPGRFSLQDIQKALNVYRRSLDSSAAPDSMVQIESLTEEVTQAVEDAIRTAAVANEIEEAEYCQFQLDQWARFYSCCVQYHEVSTEMKGIFTDPVTDLVCIIKKGCISFVRPCDNIEEVHYGTGRWSSCDIDNSLKRDVATLCMCLALISDGITVEMATQFEQQLFFKEPPHEIARQKHNEIFLNSSLTDGGMSTLGPLVQTIHDIVGALQVVLQNLDLSHLLGYITEDTEIPDMSMPSLCHLMSGVRGMQILTSTVKQITETGLLVARDLLILQIAIISLGENDGVSPDQAEEIHRELIPQTCELVHVYMLMKWITNQIAVPVQNSSIETNIRQMASLEITNTQDLQEKQRLGLIHNQRVTVSTLFAMRIGGNQTRSMLANNRTILTEPYWNTAVLSFAKLLVSLIWPMGENMLFPDFLVSCCQYLPLQQYVYRTHGWCSVNVASRRFMLGMAYLHFDEPQKAAECFDQAKEGLRNDVYLRQKVLQSEVNDIRKLEILFYLKVIKQFEEFDYADEVVMLSKTAISIASPDEENLPTLWSKLFKYQLQLGHNEEAYGAMICNPDPTRKKDCLRQLLVTLCERGDLRTIKSFNYIDMEDDVVSILENRARSVDIATQNYYHLLYAFHVSRNNFSRAGAMMYEHGMRLGMELGGHQGLQRQAQCYLAALNALRIADVNYAWIINPRSAIEQRLQLSHLSSQSKRDVGGETKKTTRANKREVLNITDIEKELILVNARLKLLQIDNSQTVPSGPTPNPDEMVGLLVNSGMYDQAILVCKSFGLKLSPVFESLALRCVNLAKGSINNSVADSALLSQAWDWLQENAVTLPSITESSATDTAWALLQHYLEMNEDSTAQYHRCVVIKLLSHGFPIPSWLVNSYKGLNWAELLRLLSDFDLLEDAVLLTMEYVDAVMATFTGQESPVFKLKPCLERTTECVWLPYTCIDQLRYALKSHHRDPLYGQLHEDLENKLLSYGRCVQNLSDQIVDILYQRGHAGH